MRQIKSLNDAFENAMLDSYSGVIVFQVQSSLENVSLMAFIYILLFSVILGVTYQLKGIFENFKDNQHFTKINIKRLRVIAIIIIIAPIIRYILSLIVNQVLFNNLKLGPFLNLSPFSSIGFLITGLFLLMVIEIFKIGVDLDEENDSLADSFKDKMLNGIVAFTITVTEIQGSQKMSQNKTVDEQERIINTLKASDDSTEKAMAGYMTLNL